MPASSSKLSQVINQKVSQVKKCQLKSRLTKCGEKSKKIITKFNKESPLALQRGKSHQKSTREACKMLS